jgi:outer membrane protein OmpA-like peptidoglycan-associated protein
MTDSDRLMRRAALLALVFTACSTAPKPKELEALEQLKGGNLVEQARKRAPSLVEDSDKFYAKAQEEWQGGKLEDSRRDALMGSIKLKTALALVEQDRAKARASAADTELRKAEDEYGRVAKDLAATNEQVALMERLRASESSAATLSQQATANAKIAEAELALKTADTVDAKTYAQAPYAAAGDTLARAKAEAQAGNWSAAAMSADMAKQKAEQATATAKPTYQQAEQSKENQARDEALGRDAAGISGVTLRLERRGDVTRLVLPLHDLFLKRQTTVAPGHDSVLDSVAGLLKKYPSYPVQIVGHTDSQGKHDQLVALSLARAQSVFDGLVSRGSDAKRFVVSGQGPDDPKSDNKSRSGRAQNNRVEIVFLYQ